MLTKANHPESKAEFWQRHIDACISSSQTQAQYCKDHSLVISRFYYWKRKLNLNNSSKARFYPLAIQSATAQGSRESGQSGLSLYCRNKNFRIEVAEDFSPVALKKLMAVLEQP